MHELHLNFDTPHNRYLGETGEHLAARLVINVKPVGQDWPDLRYALCVRRPMEREAYIAALSLQPNEQGFISYDVTSTETAIAGEVCFEAQAFDGDRLVKSTPFTLRVVASLGNAGETPTAPKPLWLLDAIEAKEAAAQHERNAKESEVSARESAETVKEIAAAAEANFHRLAITTLDINGLSPMLCAVKTDNTAANAMPRTVGWLFYVLDHGIYKFYYSKSTYDKPEYLCDWNPALCYATYTSPKYYAIGLTKEDDMIAVFRGGEVLYAGGTEINPDARQNPIVYPHGDYTAPVVVDFGTSSVPDVIQLEAIHMGSYGVSLVSFEYFPASTNLGTYMVYAEPGMEVTVKATNNTRFRIMGFETVIPPTHNKHVPGTMIINQNSLHEYTFVNTEGYKTIGIYLATEADNNENPVTVDVTATSGATMPRAKPSAWVQNAGMDIGPNGCFYFCEYTRPVHAAAYCWRVEPPYTAPENWQIIHEIPVGRDSQTGYKHYHAVSFDPFGGKLYLTTGDYNTYATIWVSSDQGDTFVLAREPGELYNRVVNFVYTKDYVYWGSDSGRYHRLLRCPRVSGVADFTQAEILHDFGWDHDTATYATAYVPYPEGILCLDRHDGVGTGHPLTVYFWHVGDAKMYTIAVIPPRSAASNTGFRCDAVGWYPSLRDGCIVCGFGFATNQIGLLNNTAAAPVNNLVLSLR